jgi:hypothetical protein
MTHPLIGVLSRRFPTGSSAKIVCDFRADLPLDTGSTCMTYMLGPSQITLHAGSVAERKHPPTVHFAFAELWQGM